MFTIHGGYKEYLISAFFMKSLNLISDKKTGFHVFILWIFVDIYIMGKCTNCVSFGLTLIEVLEQS